MASLPALSTLGSNDKECLNGKQEVVIAPDAKAFPDEDDIVDDFKEEDDPNQKVNQLIRSLHFLSKSCASFVIVAEALLRVEQTIISLAESYLPKERSLDPMKMLLKKKGMAADKMQNTTVYLTHLVMTSLKKGREYICWSSFGHDVDQYACRMRKAVVDCEEDVDKLDYIVDKFALSNKRIRTEDFLKKSLLRIIMEFYATSNRCQERIVEAKTRSRSYLFKYLQPTVDLFSPLTMHIRNVYRPGTLTFSSIYNNNWECPSSYFLRRIYIQHITDLMSILY